MRIEEGPSGAGAPQRRSVAIVVCLVLGTALGLLSAASSPASATDRSFSLYVTALGWADRPGGENGGSGPALAVVSGDNVTITITSEDGLTHGLFIDYNDNGLPDGGDYVSPTTTSNVTFSFVPEVVGLFNYCDQLAVVNCGKWTTSPSNQAPTAMILSPGNGTSWTAGWPHDIVFNVSDSDGDPVSVFLSYSYNGSAPQSIAGPVAAGPNPNRYRWTPTGFHSADTIIHLVAQDSKGLSTPKPVDSPVFEVDGTYPTILSTTPASGAASVDRGTAITVTWSEDMNPDSGGPESFGMRVQGGAWVAGTVTWSTDVRVMTFAPKSPLDPATTYEVDANKTARDSSTPGNPFAGATWFFTTSAVGDTSRPTILGLHAEPPSQIAGRPVNITVDVRDNVAVTRVDAAVTGPSTSENLTMTHGSGTRWYVNRTFTAVGHYDVVVWALDPAGNAASQSLGFDLSSAGNPNVLAPASVTATASDGIVEVTWTPVSFAGLAGYHVYRGEAANGPFVRLTIAPLPPNSQPVYHDRPPPGRTYFYAVTSVDATGSESPYSPRSFVVIPAYQTPPLFDPVAWAIAGLTLGLILGVLYGTVRRRRFT